MLAQIKYSARIRLSLRLITLGIVVIFNIFLALGHVFHLYGAFTSFSAITLSGLGLCAIFIACIISDIESVRSLVSAPAGYHTLLAPVPGWQLLLGRIIPMLVLDFLTCAVGIGGTALQAWLSLRDTFNMSNNVTGLDLVSVLTVLHYLVLILAVFFAAALCKSIFYRVKAKGLLGTGLAALVLYLLSLLNIVLSPLGSVYSWGTTVSITITYGLNPAFLAYMGLTLAKAVGLFFATAYLIERKINL